MLDFYYLTHDGWSEQVSKQQAAAAANTRDNETNNPVHPTKNEHQSNRPHSSSLTIED